MIRFTVFGWTSNRDATSATDFSCSNSSARRRWAESSAGFLPSRLPRTRRRHPGASPLADQVPLELRQRRHHVKDQQPAGRLGIDRFRQRFELDAALLEIGDQIDQLAQGSAETIQAPDHQAIAGRQVAQGGLESGPREFGAGYPLVHEYLVTAGLPERIDLQPQMLFLG